MGELFNRYFQLLAGRLPGAEYGVIATPADAENDPFGPIAEPARGCLCPGR
jgi:hypothetical protein